MQLVKKIIKNKKGGIALMLTVFCVFSIMFIALISADIVINNILTGRTQVFSTRAYFAAEAGVERILWEVRKEDKERSSEDKFLNSCSDSNNCVDWGQSECISDCSSSEPLEVAGAQAEAVYKSEEGFHVFTVIGSYRDVRRAVEIRF